jgi:signal transduction histidine kinase
VLAEYNRLQNSYMQASGVLTFLIILFVTVAVFFIRRAETMNDQLRLSYQELDEAKRHEIEMSSRLTQSEKLAALGQLAAGVAHEINNPMAFVASNLTTMHKYADIIASLMQAAQQLQEQHMTAQEFDALKKKLNFDFVLSDLRTILDETQEGVVRVKHIVDDLKNFARGDPQQAWVMSDIRQGIESTLNIVNHEIKYRAEVVWDWQDLPLVECIPSQINQVFLNLIVNAAQAMPSERVGTITLCSGIQGKTIWIEVRDNGAGMTEDVLSRIFEPFYTTKAVGVGTGLGLSVSLGIVQRHHGQLTVSSELGRGTTLRVVLPLRQK